MNNDVHNRNKNKTPDDNYRRHIISQNSELNSNINTERNYSRFNNSQNYYYNNSRDKLKKVEERNKSQENNIFVAKKAKKMMVIIIIKLKFQKKKIKITIKKIMKKGLIIIAKRQK